MHRRTWTLTALLGIAAVLFGLVAVAANQARQGAEQRQDAALEVDATATARLESARGELQEQQVAQTAAEQRAERLSTLFRPTVLAALIDAQTTAAGAGCDQARQATRSGSAVPAAEAIADLAVVTASTTNDAVAGLSDRWGEMLDLSSLQAEIERCRAEESAAIESEQQAAAAAAAAADAAAAAGPPPGFVCPANDPGCLENDLAESAATP